MAGVGTLITESHELASSSVADLFDLPNYEQALIHGKTLTYYPDASVNNNGPYEIKVPSADNAFTELPLTKLHLCLEVQKDDGSALTDTELNSVVNLLPHSIFKQIELYVNEVQINDLSTPTYAYKSYIETLLSYNKALKDTQLAACEFWNKETIGKEESFSITDTDGSKTFVAKLNKIKNKKLYFTIGLHVDFLNSARMLIPGIPLRLKFIRNDDSFSLLGATKKAKIKVHEIKLDVRRIICDPGVAESIRQSLQTKPVLYPMVQSKIKTYLLNSTTQSQTISQIFNGKMPRSFIVGMVASAGIDGHVNKNPFLFKHFDLKSFVPYFNGESIIPQPLTFNFSTGDYVRGYDWFLTNIGLNKMRSVDITIEDWLANSFFLPFDMSPDLDNAFSLRAVESGTLDFQLNFNTALEQNTTILIYASFNEVLIIDKDKNVSFA